MAQAVSNRFFPAEHANLDQDVDLSGPIVPPFDETALYIPLFATCEVPEDYLRAVFNYAKLAGLDIRPIPAVEDDSTILSAVREVTSEDIINSTNFTGWTRSELFGYFRGNLKPQEDSAEPRHFASFTIAIIEPDCLNPERPALMIGTDAPDLEDDLSGLVYEGPGPAPDDWERRWPTPGFRCVLTTPLTAMSWLSQLENLTATYTELTEQREFHYSIFPPSWLAMGERGASPEAVWRHRAMGLAKAVQAERQGDQT